MKKLICHCREVEAEINTFELENVTVNDGQNHRLEK